MFKRISLFLIILFCNYQFTIGQNIVDKLENYEKVKYLNSDSKNIDSLLFFAKELQKSDILCSRTLGRFKEANYYYKIGEYKKSEKLCLSILSSIKGDHSDCQLKNQYRTLERLFWIYKNTNEYKKAFEYLIQKESILNSIEMDELQYRLKNFSIQSNKASIRATLGFYEEAISILEKGISNIKRLKPTSKKGKYYYTFHLSSAYNILGDAYIQSSHNDYKSNALDSALVNYKKAYDIALTFDPLNDDSHQLYSLRVIKVLIQKKKFQSALSTIRNISECNSIEQEINFYKALIYYNLKTKDSSLHYAHQFLEYDRNTPSSEKNKLVIYDILANQYNHLHKPDSAYKYSRLGLNKLSELNTNKTEINKSYYSYNFNKIKTESKIEVDQEHNKHLLQLILIIAGSLIVIIFITIYYNKKRKRNLQKFDSALKEIQHQETPPKKDYNIDNELQRTILSGLENLEKSDLYLDSNFSIQQLAKIIETNTTYISYTLNNEKNLSFKQYIAQLRINYLTEKLKTDKKYHNYTIQYLAEEIGYTNASAFTRAFKKQVGITPSEYIKSLN
jgi:AraC-like DNA-binding protein